MLSLSLYLIHSRITFIFYMNFKQQSVYILEFAKQHLSPIFPFCTLGLNLNYDFKMLPQRRLILQVPLVLEVAYSCYCRSMNQRPSSMSDPEVYGLSSSVTVFSLFFHTPHPSTILLCKLPLFSVMNYICPVTLVWNEWTPSGTFVF